MVEAVAVQSLSRIVDELAHFVGNGTVSAKESEEGADCFMI